MGRGGGGFLIGGGAASRAVNPTVSRAMQARLTILERMGDPFPLGGPEIEVDAPHLFWNSVLVQVRTRVKTGEAAKQT